MPRDAYNSPSLDEPVGPFSHLVSAGETIYLSGQIGEDPATGHLRDGIVEQARQILQNVAGLLKEKGLSLDDVQKVNVYLTTMDHFDAMNVAYGESFRRPYPARTSVAVHQLPLGALVEMEMVVRGGKGKRERGKGKGAKKVDGRKLKVES